jgi:hypothetical protein
MRSWKAMVSAAMKLFRRLLLFEKRHYDNNCKTDSGVTALIGERR